MEKVKIKQRLISILACTVFLLLLTNTNSLKAEELDLSTPEATYKSCYLGLFKKKLFDSFFSRCLTREGKLDYIGNSVLMLIWVESFNETSLPKTQSNESTNQSNIDVEKILNKYGGVSWLNKNYKSISDAKLKSIFMELIALVTDDKKGTFTFINGTLDEVNYSGVFARATLLEQDKMETTKSFIFFKRTTHGWLIHEELENFKP